jgi:hypothetical protein
MFVKAVSTAVVCRSFAYMRSFLTSAAATYNSRECSYLSRNLAINSVSALPLTNLKIIGFSIRSLKFVVLLHNDIFPPLEIYFILSSKTEQS